MRNTLKPLRAEKGLTQKELAMKARCSRAYIIGLEGGNPPSIETAYRIARIFRKPVEEVFIPDWVKTPQDAPPHEQA